MKVALGRARLLLVGAALAAACTPVRPRANLPTPPGAVFEEGVASWYGPGFDGRRTASGEVFDADALTAAHPSLPFDTRVRVVRISTGRQVVVRINDRGPFTGGRIIDVSQAAAQALDMIRDGTARVRLYIVE